ncbi:MAG: CocE/NonD family hydrolase [Deltaproteobacteria bacterium]|nr:CocE/NonD family hydrolase [Deltaproteobacteria bacterium]
MRDGVRIAVDVYLPGDLAPGVKLPTIVLQTRYARGFTIKEAYRFAVKNRFQATIRRFVRAGYAWVYVDARGSGASFGVRRYPFTHDEVLDGNEVVDWIVRQPWSNGSVGAWGNSYDATAALFLVTNRNPAVKAVMPRFAFFDAYSEAVFPGGIRLSWLTDTWGRLADALDRNAIQDFMGVKALMALEGIRPVDADPDGRMLSQAVKEHAGNGDVRGLVDGIAFRDDESPAAPGLTLDAISPASRLEDLNRADTIPYLYTGWFDAAFLMSGIHLFMNLEHPGRKLTIGPWDHGGWHNISPCARHRKPRFDHDGEALRFFDQALKGRDTGIQREKPVHYYTMCEERWKAADTWPPPGTVPTDWYFGAEGLLNTEPPEDDIAFDGYEVDLKAGTGNRARWNSLVNLDHLAIRYPFRALRDRRLLVYQSPPLDADVEVTGHPKATLYVTSTTGDGNFFVYLEDVNEAGMVAYVTEGMLRAADRKIAAGATQWASPVPFHSFRRADAAPLPGDRPVKLAFGLYPTSYLFRKGHRIRVALAGADADHFANQPGATPTFRYYRSKGLSSRIELPVMPPKASMSQLTEQDWVLKEGYQKEESR